MAFGIAGKEDEKDKEKNLVNGHIVRYLCLVGASYRRTPLHVISRDCIPLKFSEKRLNTNDIIRGHNLIPYECLINTIYLRGVVAEIAGCLETSHRY